MEGRPVQSTSLDWVIKRIEAALLRASTHCNEYHVNVQRVLNERQKKHTGQESPYTDYFQ